jgi:chromosome segregation ATPase
MAELLEEWDIKEGFKVKLQATLGDEPTAPPVAVLEGRLCNEYFAYFVLTAQSTKFTVRNAYELIGGGFNKVADNVRRVRPLLPRQEASDAGSDALGVLKAEIRKEEQRLMNIELQDQETFYVAKLAQLALAHDTNHDKIISDNAALTVKTELLGSQNTLLSSELGELKIRDQGLTNSYSQVQSELRGLQAKVDGQKVLLQEKDRFLESLKTSSAQTITAFAGKLKSLGSELEEYQGMNKRLMTEISQQREDLLASHETLAAVQAELEVKNSQILEHNSLSEINQHMVNCLGALDPLIGLIGKLQTAKQDSAINNKTITTAIHSVDGKVADVNGKLGSLQDQLNSVLSIVQVQNTP